MASADGIAKHKGTAAAHVLKIAAKKTGRGQATVGIPRDLAVS